MNRRGFLKFFGLAGPAAAIATLPETKPAYPVLYVKREIGEFTMPDGCEVKVSEHVLRMSDGTEIDKFLGVPPGLPYIEEGPAADSAAKLAKVKADMEAKYAERGVVPQHLDWRVLETKPPA
jgi:hypothetical protein